MENEILFTQQSLQGSAYAEIILNRPTKGNAFTLAMLDRLEAIVAELAQDRSVRAVVLRGNGRFFCTGGDIGEWGALTPDQMSGWILRGVSVFQAMAALPQPVIAAISGHALGGGLELALAADLRLATRAAKLGTPEVTLGMVAGWMGVRRLAETIGASRARHMTLLGSAITAEQAFDWGLITSVAETPEALDEQLLGWLDRLLANGPIAMALTKGLLAGVHSDTRYQHAAAAAHAASTQDCAEGVRAFAEKRVPVFQNQ